MAAVTKAAQSSGEPEKPVEEDDIAGLLAPLFSGIAGAILTGVSTIIGLRVRVRRARRERDQET